MNQDKRMKLNEIIARNLKAWMLVRGIRQTELAQSVGVSQSTIARLTKGQVNCSAVAIGKVCEKLEIDVSDLVYDKRKKRAS